MEAKLNAVSNQPWVTREEGASADQRVAGESSPFSLPARLRDLRKRRGLTLREAGKRAGLSHSLLSQLELGRTNASLTTLSRLASIYGVTLSQIFDDKPDAAAGQIVRRHERVPMECISPNIADWLVAPSSGGFSVLLSIVEPRSDGGEPIQQAGGQKLLFVLRGVVHVHLAEQLETLYPGDAVSFDSAQPHGISNPGWEPAEVLCVISSPDADSGATSRQHADDN